MKDEALEAYCESVEREFFRHKGRPGTLSPADFARAREWYRAEVPLGAAIAAIEKAFWSHARGRERDVEEVNSLAYCESFLEKGISRRRGGRTKAPAR
ncbi:MAG TPA: hypothetical protein VJ921_14255 [Vicinamibacteria bacterium]|nr:hypothetical protein [Vicinamibacteria bacterium]